MMTSSTYNTGLSSSGMESDDRPPDLPPELSKYDQIQQNSKNLQNSRNLQNSKNVQHSKNLQNFQNSKNSDNQIQLSNSLFTNPTNQFSDESTPKICEYLGSFTANQDDLKSRIEYVETQINLLSQKRLENQNHESSSGSQVCLVLSFSGLRVCSLDLQHTFTVHALRRICHATCEPVSQLFAFTARDAGDEEYQCHIFHTKQAFY